MRYQEARALRTAGERPLAKADAQFASSESMSEGERKPPRSPAVSDLDHLRELRSLLAAFIAARDENSGVVYGSPVYGALFVAMSAAIATQVLLDKEIAEREAES